MSDFIDMGLYMNGIAAMTAVFNVILIFTAGVNADVGMLAAKRTDNHFIQ